MSENADIKAILTNPNMTDRTIEYYFFKKWLGESIFTANGDAWKLKTKQYYPFFNIKFVQNAFPVFEHHSENLIESMKNNTGIDFDIYHKVDSFAIDVIIELTLGIRNNSHENPTNFQHYLHENSKTTVWRMFHPVFRYDFLFSFTHKCKEGQRMIKEFRAYIQEAIERTRKKGLMDHRKTLIDIDCSISQSTLPMSDVKIQDNLLSTIYGGFGTMSSSVSFLTFCLAKYPEVQEKVYQEIKENINPNEPLTIPTLNTLKYTNLVIKEALRMYTPAPSVLRSNSEPLELNGYTYPANTSFVLSLYNAHHNPENYEDPEEFLPERHDVSENSENNIHNFVAFAPGARGCRGNKIAEYQLKTFVVKMLNSYKIGLKEGFEPELSWDIILKPYNGIWINLSARN
ncbi:cytochrome P450 4d2-like [Culicoides brevitarsis]|uniref:cytochrome P450 4d2-like n=1 Tax=Culicoides brevitarsis TaxID=469753 RepID=UPI00307C2BE2